MGSISPALEREIISRRLLRAMALLVVTSLMLVTYARMTHRPLEAKPIDGPIAVERTIHLYGQMNGSARVTDADGTVIADLSPRTGGFVAGVWRALAFERDRAHVDPAEPVRLVRFKNGRLSLMDDKTGWRIELIGFGQDNTNTFEKFLNNQGE